MSTCTPSVYNGRIYLGVSGSKGQFSQNGGHCIEVIDLDTATGEMSYAYSYGIIGYPQTSAMVSTAYVDKDFDGDGAGDGYVCGFLYGLVHGRSVHECALLGGTLSSFVLEKEGSITNLPTEAQLLARYETIRRDD